MQPISKEGDGASLIIIFKTEESYNPVPKKVTLHKTALTLWSGIFKKNRTASDTEKCINK